MIKRPKPGEDEDDILKMQEEFLREKNTNQNWQPAAQVVNLRPTEATKRPCTEPGTRKPSKYAKAKGLGNTEKRVKLDTSTAVLGDILEKNVEEPEKNELDDDKVYFPKVIPSILGNIVEKNIDNFDLEFKPMPSQGFPVAEKRNPNAPSKKTVQNQNNESQNEPLNMDVDIPSCSKNIKETNNLNIPEKSYVVTSEEADKIHTDNVKVLEKMSETEILDEQQKLLSSLDPKLVEFIKSKRKTKPLDQKTKSNTVKVKAKAEIDNINTVQKNTEEKMDTSEPVSNYDTLWDNDVLSHPEVNKWLHFDSLERDKFEWMKGIEESKKIKPDQPYEARFDFKGYLLPYTMEYTEATKPLFHHGEEPHRPGYTFTELIELSRSSIIQQRVMSLNTIAGILEYYSAGTYKEVIEIPLSKIFFVIRIAMDENKVIILEPALKAMRNLLYNRIDEASLDALIGFEEGMNQPCLENDKSEIDELESQESELKDFHLAEVDIITALMRTNILQRLYYILDTIKPSFNCVQYCLQILTRLARDSVDTTQKIMEADHLMNSIIDNFIPATGVNFVFEPNIVYNGKPVLAALKFLRVLSLQSVDIAGTLVSKFNVLKHITMYIHSGADRSYGLRIQIEAYCIWSNLLHYGLGSDCLISLSPVILVSLYKHVQGTDIFIQSSILSATHAAILLQIVNKLLICKIPALDQVKSQIYPLLQEGVQKWITQLCNSDNYTCAHLRIVCSALDCCKTVLSMENVPVKLNIPLKELSTSKGFQNIVKNILPSSNLLSNIESKDLHVTKNLMSLKCSVIDSQQKVLPVLNVGSPMPFLVSLFKLLTVVDDKEISQTYLTHLCNYLRKFSNVTPSLCDNWFTRMETDFVFNILKLSAQCDITESDKDLLYAVANRLCYVLRIDKRYELDFLFTNIVFNKTWFTAERLLNLVNLSHADGFSKVLTSIEDIKQCYCQIIKLNYKDTGPNVVLRKWMEPILPRDWIYLPILILYSKSQEPETSPTVIGECAKKIAAQRAAEKEFIVSFSLEWILFNEICFADLLDDIDATDRFCRIMCVFLCDNSLFLDPKIKSLLQRCIQLLFKKRKAFNFDKDLTGLNNFQDFYTQFLEQFQSVSYGDPTFAACVLVPLAQNHNVKWRKLLWSEYAGCLRALDCPVESLCYDLQEYLYPEETDDSVLKSYVQALSSNLLRPGTIVHKIATHHVECLKNRAAAHN